ncbi:hypothetical protein BDF21DRAFT_434627 [Thamnidium elegans]|nr:hypothetical protein BDF21DRAFT_434627 [Thamnidium elegans]
MTETVPLNLERLNYHLRLHNMYRQFVTQMEINLAENSFSKAITIQETKRAYKEQIVSREQLREFYEFRKRASAKRKVEIWTTNFETIYVPKKERR